MRFFLKSLKEKIFSEIADIPEVFRQSHFPSLDGLRALSILLVLLFHIVLSYKINFDFHPLANLGVQFFFVISGFLITTLLIKEKVKTGSVSFRNFYIRRFLRIIPVAYLYLSLVTLLNYFFHLGMDYFAIIASFLFIRNFFLSYAGVNHMTGHWWSLSVEEQFYLIFPAILKKNLNLYLGFLVFIILFSIGISFFELTAIAGPKPLLLFLVKLITQFQGIAVGSIFSVLIFKKIIVVGKPIHRKSLITILLLSMIVALTFVQRYFTTLIIFFECLLFAIILIMNLNEKDRGDFFYRFLNNKKIKLIGSLSFSLYVWQQPFTLGLNRVNTAILATQIKNKVLIDVLITLLSFALLVFISCLSYFFFEKKFLKLKERFYN